ncbi:MAG: arginine--tRNA ligase [Thermoproteota archaeon]
MISKNPLADFHIECQKNLKTALQKEISTSEIKTLSLEIPPTPDFGQLASSLCFELARQRGEPPLSLAERIVEAMEQKAFSLIDRVVTAGGGYINFHINFPKFSALTVNSIQHLDERYGFIKTDDRLNLIVEHTSVNPLHPIHIGQARNPMLGDAIVRILSSRGHQVSRHYYIDDVGRQTAVVAYGYQKLGQPEPDGKPDTFIGKIYTITNCLVEITRLKKELKHTQTSMSEDRQKIRRELDEWVQVASELEETFPSLFDRLLERIKEDEDPESTIAQLNQAYEAGDSEAKQLIRRVSELCLQGFRETLDRAGVYYDSWDWESRLVWSSRVQKVLEGLKNTPYVSSSHGVLKFNAEKIAEDLDLKKKLGLNQSHEIPSLTLVRADGTTLYPTRDLAYTLWKFQRAEKVINVIGMEQKLPQLQLRLALYALGHKSYAENLVHFAYNLVKLPNYKMSGRRGRYVTFDEAIDEAVKRAYQEVSKRSPNLPEKEKQRIADFVGKGAVRYALVEVAPSKPVVFTWDRVLNFETNSAPYLQYSHARACSILRKAGREPENPPYNLLNDNLEQEITMMLASFPNVFIEAAELLKPHLIPDFANALADKFNTFYNSLPVIQAETRELSDARLTLVEAVTIVLRNSLNLIGIVAPESM